MSIIEAFSRFAEEHHLFLCDAVLLAVSGGVDSMCLLDMVRQLKDRSDSFPALAVAHLHHGLRGDQADRDAHIVKNYAEKYRIPFFVQYADVQTTSQSAKMGLEAGGRIARYTFFHQITKELQNQYPNVRIATAHHREDQAESVLMHVFRGCGTEGLCGMQPVRGQIIRPMLFMSKGEIYRYIREENIPYGEDETNSDPKYRRNLWRTRLLPMIGEALGIDPVQAVCSLSELAALDQDFIEGQARVLAERVMLRDREGTPFLQVDAFLALHPALKSRLLRLLMDISVGEHQDIERKHMDLIGDMVEKGYRDSPVYLPRDRVAFIRDGGLYIGVSSLYDCKGVSSVSCGSRGGKVLLSDDRDRVVRFDDLRWNDGHEMCFSHGQVNFFLSLVVNRGQVVYNDKIWYCSEEVFRSAELRTKRSGDFFCRAGASGAKPLRRFLTDEKIPAVLRDRLLLFAQGDRVLWLPGIGHGTGFTDAASHAKWLEETGREDTSGIVRIRVECSTAQEDVDGSQD